MWKIFMLLAAIPLCLGSALACDDHVGDCEIEDWRWRSPLPEGSFIVLEGSTTCDKGNIRIRLYDGAGSDAQFLGIADGTVDGHAFKALAERVPLNARLSIRYSISPPPVVDW